MRRRSSNTPARASNAQPSQRFTVWPIQPTDPTCFFADHSTSRETNSASLRSPVVAVIIMSEQHSEARHGEDASDRCGRTDPGKGRRDHRLRCSRSRDQSVVLRAEEARLDRPHPGAPCRGRLAHGRGLYPRQGRQYRRLHRHLGPGRHRHDHGALFGDRGFDPDPVHHRAGAARAALQGRLSGRSISNRSQSP